MRTTKDEPMTVEIGSLPERTVDPRTGKIGAPEPIAALNRVKIIEKKTPWDSREPLVDIRTFCPDVVIAEERVCPFLRQRAAEMLNAAQASLPTGFKLKVGTALRTLTMQKSGWDGFFQKQKEEHPDWPLSALRRATNKFFAPYDQPAPPGHATGGAVDVALLNPAGETLDLIAPTTGWEAAYTWSDKISLESKYNRMMMADAMLGAGFSNCRDEYWHYSYGDSAWAVRVGEKSCPYDWAHPPVRLETDFPSASASNLNMFCRRDPKDGKALSAEGSCDLPDNAPLTEEGTPYWRAGLYWAKNVPVTFHLQWNSTLPYPLLFMGEKEGWEPIAETERSRGVIVFCVTPTADRIFLSNTQVGAG